MALYELLRDAHNLIRWFILLFGFMSLVFSYRAWLTRSPWMESAQRMGLLFISTLHLQLLTGLILYMVSPLTKVAMGNMGAAMGNRILRFFAVEHVFLMVIAIILAQVGFSISKRATDPTRKARTAAIFFTVAFLLILAGIPWPGLEYGKPLWPSFNWLG